MTSRFPWITLTLAMVTALVYVLAAPGSPAFQALVLSDTATGLRLVTGHWVHTDSTHLLWNLVALLVLGLALERVSRGQLVMALIAGMVMVDLWFFAVASVSLYAGLSGLLNSLLVVGLYGYYLPASRQGPAAPDTAEPREPPTTADARPGAGGRTVNRTVNNVIVILVFAGAVAKLLYEMATGESLVSRADWPSVPGAHLAGLLGGVLAIAGVRLGHALAPVRSVK